MHITAIDKEARAVTYKTSTMIRDVWRFIVPYQVRFWGASFARLIGDLANLYPALAFAFVVTYLSDRTQPISELYVVLALWVLALVVRSVMQYIAKYNGFLVAERVVLDATDHAMQHITKLDMGWHERENSGNKIKRITTAGDSMRTLIRMWIGNLIEIAVNFVGMLAILSAIDATMGLVMLGFMVTYAPLAYFMTRQAAEATYAVHKKNEVVTGLMYEAVGNIRTVNVLNMAAAIQGMVKRALDDCIASVRRRIMLFQSRNAILELYMQLYRIAALGAIIYGILHGHYELGFLVLFYQYFSRMQESVREVTDVGHEIMAARLAISRMQDMLDVPPRVDGTTTMPPAWKSVVMHEVGFAYGDAEVLKGISFTLSRGEKVGIVGLSGAGKSTLFKLLLKERDEYTGEISVDGVPLRDISRASYFERVAAVLQDTEVFNLSLKDNVTFGAPGTFDQETFDQALSTAHVTDFLHKLPQGVDTQIGERGVKLSGGERQRLGIARALYRKPQLILMDEATSHLDSDSEEKIQDSLTQVFESATAVVIAHRFSTIRAMDRILVIEGGTIIEEGTFAELQTNRGRFAELWEKQRL